MFLLLSLSGQAHEVRPGYLELRVDEAGHVNLFWKIPTLDGRTPALRPVLPKACQPLGEPVVSFTRDAHVETASFDCGARGLNEGHLAVDGLALTLMDVLVRVERPGVRPLSQLLRAGEPTLDLAASAPGMVGAYFRLGVEHILFGFDHLAFVLGLVVLVRGVLMLIGVLSAFTVAHSLTLASGAFGFVLLSPAVVEALIAFSILMLAVEIVQQRRSSQQPSLLLRAPWMMAFAFGLLHGFGFAGALTQIGLPPDAILLALLLFNLGVEAGQLLFVAMLLVVARTLGPRLPVARFAPLGVAYAIGVAAVYWSIERVAAMFMRL